LRSCSIVPTENRQIFCIGFDTDRGAPEMARLLVLCFLCGYLAVPQSAHGLGARLFFWGKTQRVVIKMADKTEAQMKYIKHMKGLEKQNPPTEAVSKQEAGELWSYFSFQGRLSRKQYWSVFAGLIFVAFIIRLIGYSINIAFPNSLLVTALMAFIGVLFLICQVAALAKRCRDAGINPLFTAAIAVPIIGIFVFAAIVSLPTIKAPSAEANEVSAGYMKHIKNIITLKKPETQVKSGLSLNAGMKSTAPISTSVAGVKAGLNLHARLEPYFTVSVIARAVAVVLLFWGLTRHHSDYYTVLRWVVCGACAYSAFVAFSLKKHTWVWGLGFIALFFNPLIPVRLDRDSWEVIYVLIAGTLIISIFFAREVLTKTSSVHKD